MKRIDLFCASPASTAICVSMDERSMVRHGGRAIDRHTRLIDGRRPKPPPLPPSSSSFAAAASSSSSSSIATGSQKPQPPRQKPRKSAAKLRDLVSPPGSSRYLLGEGDFFDVFPDFDPISALVPVPAPTTVSPPLKAKTAESDVFMPPPPPPPSQEQVVVLRVSLHCKGCEGKVRKHISRMQGVKSFNIDFSAKKVTVVGDVTPLGVLASISRVKNAQFWPSPPPPPPPPSSSSMIPTSVY